MNREQIKLTAIAAMTINHTAIALVPPQSVMYIIMTDIGYLTAVTMCYFLVEGYYHTRSKMAYMQRLGVSAIVSQVPYMLALGLRQLNMLFTLFICFVVIWVMDKVKQMVLKIPAVVILFCCSFFCDWAFKAVLFTVWLLWFNSAFRCTNISRLILIGKRCCFLLLRLPVSFFPAILSSENTTANAQINTRPFGNGFSICTIRCICCCCICSKSLSGDIIRKGNQDILGLQTPF